MSSLNTSELVKPTLEQLKAGAFDRIKGIEVLQNELRYINAEIDKFEVPTEDVALPPKTDKENETKSEDEKELAKEVKKEPVAKEELNNKDIGVKK